MSFPSFHQLKPQLDTLDNSQAAFIAGYLWAKTQAENAASFAPQTQPSITILSGSQTGNARGVAEKLHNKIAGSKLINLGDYNARHLSKEHVVLLVVSTQGEGEPPEEAISLYRFLNGKKVPKLDDLQFAVFGLGDSSYPDFCQAGKDFEALLEKHGAKRIIDRVDVDLDFDAIAESWINNISGKAQTLFPDSPQAPAQPAFAGVLPNALYTKENPFTATLLNKHPLVDIKAEKQTLHLEIDLGDSGIQYHAGDALGVFVKNHPTTVQNILKILQLDGEQIVSFKGENASLYDTLIAHCDLNQLTPKFTQWYQKSLGQGVTVNHLDTNLLGLIKRFPNTTLSASALVENLKPLTPRLYSIASSQSEVGDEEVHICVGLVNFEVQDDVYSGCASHYLAHLDIDDSIDIFIEPNPRFKLPSDTSKPIIMIGAGTGIAPYRGFIQARKNSDGTGDNWLFFGNRNSRLDFLYQSEWIQYRDQGVLTNVDLAWSRPAPPKQKQYVQDALLHQATQVWQSLEQGAYVYVCGDVKRMAKDVEKALLNIIEHQGKLSIEAAQEYLEHLRESQRYQRDVY